MLTGARFCRRAELGLGNSVHVNAYRIAGLVPGSLSLILADFLPWAQVFLITALFVLPGLLLALFAAEPLVAKSAPKTLREAVVRTVSRVYSPRGVARGGVDSGVYLFL